MVTAVCAVIVRSGSSVVGSPIYSPVHSRNTHWRQRPPDTGFRLINGNDDRRRRRPLKGNRKCTQKRGAKSTTEKHKLVHGFLPIGLLAPRAPRSRTRGKRLPMQSTDQGEYPRMKCV
jgi:hypothetical protein